MERECTTAHGIVKQERRLGARARSIGSTIAKELSDLASHLLKRAKQCTLCAFDKARPVVNCIKIGCFFS